MFAVHPMHTHAHTPNPFTHESHTGRTSIGTSVYHIFFLTLHSTSHHRVCSHRHCSAIQVSDRTSIDMLQTPTTFLLNSRLHSASYWPSVPRPNEEAMLGLSLMSTPLVFLLSQVCVIACLRWNGAPVLVEGGTRVHAMLLRSSTHAHAPLREEHRVRSVPPCVVCTHHLSSFFSV
jgi:hypothetical protein